MFNHTMLEDQDYHNWEANGCPVFEDVSDWVDEMEYNLQDHQAHIEAYWNQAF